MKTLLLTFFLGLCLVACNEKQKQESILAEELSFPEWAKDAVIYEANTRQMSEEGTFNALESQLERIKNMGIEIIWLMPIHPISLKKRKAKGDLNVEDIEDPEERKKYLGSAYSVRDYRAVNPDFGSMDDFRSLLSTAHSLGLKIIIDWVPNHTGWDHAWITEHPDWYTQDAEGNIIDPIDYNTGKSWGWTDVADLNYDNDAMRKEMIATMKWWLSEIGIDGFRVDVAHGVPQDFWDAATPELLSANESVFLLAESDRPENLNNNTFHMDYAWSLHHLLNEISQSKAKASDIDKWRKEEQQKYQQGIHMNFTSNHDENSWAGTVFERMGEAHKAMAVFTSTFEGMPLLYSGQEVPLRKRLAFFTKDTIDFSKMEYSDFYTTLFQLKRKNTALWNAEYGGEIVKLFDDENVYAFTRAKDGDTVLVIINMSAEIQEINIPIDVNMIDVFTGDTVTWSKGEKIEIPAWRYYVLSNR